MDSAREIENLIYHYAELIDAGNLAGIAELFRHGRITSPAGGASIGYDGVLALYQGATRLYEDGTPRTQHVTSNVIVEVDDAAGTATARAYFTVFQCTPQLPLQTIICGRYEDRFKRIGQRWWFDERRMFPRLLGDLSQHLLSGIDRLDS